MYGYTVSHLSQKGDAYGFVDERVVRTAAGVSLTLGFFALFLVIFRAEFTIPLWIISVIWIDFILRVIRPQIAPLLFLVGLFYQRSEAQWVGSVQKRFAWGIGLFLTTFSLWCLLIQSGTLPVSAPPVVEGLRQLAAFTAAQQASGALILIPPTPPIIACFLCLIFMWCEAILGYCVGCHIYGWLVRKGWLGEQKGQNCVNGVCEMK